MPAYDSECTVCRHKSQYVCRVVDRNKPPLCGCGGKTRKVILNAPMGYVKGNFAAFKSPVDGSIITGERALRDHNARNGVVNVHEGFDEAKVLSGDFGRSEAKPDKKGILNDVAEAAYKLEFGGYTPPPREAYSDE